MPDVELPALGESVTEGTVTQWLKSEGDTVEVDEPLLEVSTDKVDTEIPSPVSGTLLKILVGEDETVEVGAILANIGEAGSSVESSDAGGSSDAQAPAAAAPVAETAQQEVIAAAEVPVADVSPVAEAPTSADAGEQSTVEMPALGESVTEGTITQWLKSEGDDVAVDEPLLEVSTDKVDTEIPSPVAGKLIKILAQEDDTVEVGAGLAIVGSAVSAPPAATVPAPPEQVQPEPVQSAPVQPEPVQSAPAASASEAASAVTSGGKIDNSGDDLYVTPLVRKLADEHGINLRDLTGTGVGGRIRKHDVLAAAEQGGSVSAAQPVAPAKPEKPAPSAPPAAPVQPATASAPVAPSAPMTQPSSPAPSAAPAASSSTSDLAAKRGTTEKMSRLRKVIASRMVESLKVSAQLTTVVEADVTNVARLRARHKEEFFQREGVKLSFMPFFALAAVEALKEFPEINASVEDDMIQYHAQENLGIAVDTERGLLVPVIKDAGDLNIAGLARKIDDLAQRTRNNRVGPDELSGGTFTLTNTGSRGALFDTPIINQPQVGILGTGTVVKRPVVVKDEYGSESIAVRSMVYLALTYDHRIVDGADAARFLTSVKDRLEAATFEI